MKKTVSELQLFLTLAFVVCLLVSNVITAKQVQFPFGITMTGAIFVFPITYILSDVFSECYGYRWSRMTCYMAFAANLFMAVVFQFVISTPAPEYWTNQEAFQTVLGNTPRVLLASFLGFLAGDLANDRLFRRMKADHQNELKGFGARAILSSLAGEAVDSALFFPIAFWGQMPAEALLVMGVVQVFLKVGYEVLILPVTTQVAKSVTRYESE